MHWLTIVVHLSAFVVWLGFIAFIIVFLVVYCFLILSLFGFIDFKFLAWIIIKINKRGRLCIVKPVLA